MDHICECPICYETFTSDDLEAGRASCNERQEVRGCGHAFCRNCLVDHCKHSITARDIPIRCPAHGSHQCLSFLEEHQVKDLLQPVKNDDLDEKNVGKVKYGSISEALHSDGKDPVSGVPHWTQFQRFMQKIQDPTLIHCTRCNDLVSPHQTGNLSQPTHPNDILCPHCGHKFCVVHGDAHPEQSCKDYKPARHDRQDMKSIQAIRRFTKPCSHCGVPIHKESGCDHIVCASCKHDMCFRCGSHEFLSGEMVRSCSKCEQTYIDHRYIWRYRMTLCLTLPLYIPICILHVLIMATLAMATCGCFCCLGCGIKEILPEDDNDAKNNTNETPTKGKSRFLFRPMLGVTTVLAMVFLPVVDLANQCGLSCCLDVPGITSAETSLDSDDDDASDGDIPIVGEQ